MHGLAEPLTETIDLTAHAPLRRGGARNIYALPQFPGLLLKTIRPERVNALGFFPEYGAIKNMRPHGCYHGMVRELTEFMIHCRRHHHARGFRLPIAHLHGLAHTTEGLGLFVERIDGPDGDLAPTLEQLARAGALAPRHLAAFDAFIRRCQEEHVVFGDVHARNVVYTETRTGAPECVCIDGYGEKTAIPVHRWSKRVNARRLERVKGRILGVIKLEEDEYPMLEPA